MEGSKIEEDVVADTSLPERRGWKAESRGSTLCRTAITYILCKHAMGGSIWR